MRFEWLSRPIHSFSLLVSLVLASPNIIGQTLPPDLDAAIRAQEWEEVSAQASAWKSETAAEKAAALYWRGLASMELNRKMVAEQEFVGSLEAHPNLPAARGYAQISLKQNKGDQLLKIAEEWPHDAEIRYLVGKFFRWKSNVDFTRTTPEGYLASVIHERLARSHLEAAIALDPRHAKAHVKLAECLRIQGEEEAALKHLNIARNLDALGTQDLELVARQYATLKEYDTAADLMAEAFENALMYDPGGFNTYPKLWADTKRRAYLASAGRLEEALEGARNLLERDSLDSSARNQLGKIAYAAGDYRLALFGFREGWRYERNLDSLAGTARCLLDLEQFTAAKTAIARVFEAAEEKEKKPKSTWYYIRGRCLWEEGKRKDAAKDFHTAVRLNKAHPEFMEWALRAAREMDDPLGAVYVARSYGLSRLSNADEAIGVLRTIPEIWPMPKMVSPLGSMGPYGSTNHAYRYIAEIELKRRNFQTAFAFFQKAGGKQLFGTEGTWEGWIAFHAGEMKLAEDLFTHNLLTSPHQKDRSQFGRAVAAMFLDDWDLVETAIGAISTESEVKPFADLLQSWVTRHRGDVSEVQDLDLLGVAAKGFSGRGLFYQGLEVETLLPGSPLAHTDPPLLPGDVLVLVGDYPIRDAECLEAARQASFSEKPVSLLVRRGDDCLFEVDVDFAAARRLTSEREAR